MNKHLFQYFNIILVINPYNYNGIGYNKIPSQPEIKNYDLDNEQWLFCGNKKLLQCMIEAYCRLEK